MEIRWQARRKDYVIHDYDKCKPVGRTKELMENTGRRYHMREPDTKSKVDDESYLIIMHKHPQCVLYLDPRDPRSRTVLAAFEKMHDAVPGDVPYDWHLVDMWKNEHKSEKLKKYGPVSRMPIMEDNGDKADYWACGSWPIIAVVSQCYQHRHNKLKIYPTEMRKRCHCDQMMFQSNEFVRVVMEEYPNINGVILRGEKPKEEKWEKVREFMHIYDCHLKRKPKIEKWYEYAKKEGIRWYISPDKPEYTWMGDDYFQVTDMMAALPILTLLSTRLVSEERLFEGHERVKLWYERVLEKDVFTRCHEAGNKQLIDTFHKALDGELNGDFPELKVEDYVKITAAKTRQRFEP